MNNKTTTQTPLKAAIKALSTNPNVRVHSAVRGSTGSGMTVPFSAMFKGKKNVVNDVKADYAAKALFPFSTVLNATVMNASDADFDHGFNNPKVLARKVRSEFLGEEREAEISRDCPWMFDEFMLQKEENVKEADALVKGFLKEEEARKQKFKKGDLVRIAKNLGQSMSHFRSDCEAIVIGSYADRDTCQSAVDPNHFKEYTLFIEGVGTSSWYKEDQLTLIKSGEHDLLEKQEQAVRFQKYIQSQAFYMNLAAPGVMENMVCNMLKPESEKIKEVWETLSSPEGLSFLKSTLKDFKKAKAMK